MQPRRDRRLRVDGEVVPDIHRLLRRRAEQLAGPPERAGVGLAVAEGVRRRDGGEGVAQPDDVELEGGELGRGVGQRADQQPVGTRPPQQARHVVERPGPGAEGVRPPLLEPREGPCLPGKSTVRRHLLEPRLPHRGKGQLAARVAAEEAARVGVVADAELVGPLPRLGPHLRDAAGGGPAHGRAGVEQGVVDVEQQRGDPRRRARGHSVVRSRRRRVSVDERARHLAEPELALELVDRVSRALLGLHARHAVLERGHRVGVEGQLLVGDEEEAEHGAGLLEQLHALLHQRGGLGDQVHLRRGRLARQLARPHEVRDDPAGEVLRGQRTDVVAVEPVELVHVEDRADRVDLGPLEALHELVERADLLAVRHRRVAHELQEVQQRLGQVALLAEPGQAGGGVLALGDLGLVGVAQQRHVRELRHLPPEPAMEQDVLGGRGDPLLAAHDRGDAHEVVVDHDGQVIGREAVGLEDDLVVRGGRVDPAADDVLEAGLDVLGDQHAHDGPVGESRQRRALLAGLAVAQPVVAGGQLGLLLQLAHLGQALGRAPAVVRVAVRDELLDIRPVGVQPLALPVGRVGAADIGALVVGQPQPGQRVEDLLLAALDVAGLVGVLDAQDEPAAGLAGPGEVEQRHVGGPDVRVAGGRRGDTGASGGESSVSHGGVSLSGAAGCAMMGGDDPLALPPRPSAAPATP